MDFGGFEERLELVVAHKRSKRIEHLTEAFVNALNILVCQGAFGMADAPGFPEHYFLA
ncbi:hypothetical protein ACFL1U_00790 [Patescibacteria group bacterium]